MGNDAYRGFSLSPRVRKRTCKAIASEQFLVLTSNVATETMTYLLTRKSEQNSVQRAEFDKFAEEYRSLHAANITASGESPEYFAEYKVRDVSRALWARRASVRRILDFGAGVGTSVPYLRVHFPNASLTCLDVSEKSLNIGRSRYPSEARFEAFDGTTIPFKADTFDVAFAACVFHHIEPAEHLSLLRELRRVLTPTGLLVIFEHNPLNPLTLRAVHSCAFDENATLLRASTMAQCTRKAGFSRIERRFRIFFPHALRTLRPLEQFLTWCPLGAQYSIFATK